MSGRRPALKIIAEFITTRCETTRIKDQTTLSRLDMLTHERQRTYIIQIALKRLLWIRVGE
jgi:hypothetical protein